MTEVNIVGDFGGTNARLGVSRDDRLDMASIREYRCRDYPNPASIITAYMDDIDVSEACNGVFAVAGSSADPKKIVFTNGPWKQRAVDFTDVQIKEVQTMNDFAAVCYSVASLTPQDCSIILESGQDPFYPSSLLADPRHMQVNKTQLLTSDPSKRFVTIGPGTGLGVSSGCVTDNGQFIVLGGEGGHTTFAPNSPEEMELMKHLSDTDKIVTKETVASGTGLAMAFNAYCHIRQINHSIKDASELPDQLSINKPKEIKDAALATLILFAETLGRSAASAALTNNAHTVFLAGGVIPKLGELFRKNAFSRAFRDNDLGSNNMLQRVPVVQITHPQPGLLGCHSYLKLQNGG
jgi:glucokinase